MSDTILVSHLKEKIDELIETQYTRDVSKLVNPREADMGDNEMHFLRGRIAGAQDIVRSIKSSL